MSCKICNGEIQDFDVAKVLGKYNVKYYNCPNCGAIYTEKPYWLKEAYSEAISSLDVGLVGRNLNNVPLTSRIIDFLYPNTPSGGGGKLLFGFCRWLWTFSKNDEGQRI